MGSDWTPHVWYYATRESKLETTVGCVIILLVLSVVCGCSNVGPYVRSDNVRLEKAERIEIGLKGKF